MTFEEFIKLVDLLKWPLVFLIVCFWSRKSIFNFISQYEHVEFESNVARVILKKLKTDNNVSNTQVKRLRGLTGHDLWALDAFIKQPNETYKQIDQFSATRKAMVFSFVEMGLLEIAVDEVGRYVKPTQLTEDVIEAANNLL